METDESVKSTDSNLTTVTATTTTVTGKQKQTNVLPEVDLYIHLLVVVFAIDSKKHKQVCSRISISLLFFYIRFETIYPINRLWI